MNNYLQKFLFLCIFLIINSAFAYQELDRIIAIVNKEIITFSDLSEGVEKAHLFFKQNSIPPPDESIIEKKVLDELIEQKIIESYASEWNIVASQEDIDLLINNILKSNDITLDEFKTNLKQQGTTYEKMINNLSYEIILKKGESILVNNMIWDYQKFMTGDDVLLVLCSTPFDKTDYIDDKEKFTKIVGDL